MSLADDLAAHKPPAPGCSVGRILTTLDKTDRTALEAALADKAWASGRLCDLIRRNGHKVGDGTLASHRNGTCACVTV